MEIFSISNLLVPIVVCATVMARGVSISSALITADAPNQLPAMSRARRVWIAVMGATIGSAGCLAFYGMEQSDLALKACQILAAFSLTWVIIGHYLRDAMDRFLSFDEEICGGQEAVAAGVQKVAPVHFSGCTAICIAGLFSVFVVLATSIYTLQGGGNEALALGGVINAAALLFISLVADSVPQAFTYFFDRKEYKRALARYRRHQREERLLRAIEDAQWRASHQDSMDPHDPGSVMYSPDKD